MNMARVNEDPKARLIRGKKICLTAIHFVRLQMIVNVAMELELKRNTTLLSVKFVLASVGYMGSNFRVIVQVGEGEVKCTLLCTRASHSKLKLF